MPTSTGAAATRCAAGTSRRAATCGSRATASSPRAPAAASPRSPCRRPRALADLHRRQHPRVVALDEARHRTREADRVRGRRRRRSRTDRARPAPGMARCRTPSAARSSCSPPTAPGSSRSTRPSAVRHAERALARLRRGARGRERAARSRSPVASSARLVRARRAQSAVLAAPGLVVETAARARDPPRRQRSHDPASGRVTLLRLLGGHRRVRDRQAAAAPADRERPRRPLPHARRRGSRRSSGGVASSMRPAARSASPRWVTSAGLSS